MRFFLNTRRDVARALNNRYIVWCVSTGEGFSVQASSFNAAKRWARFIMNDFDRNGWCINGDKEE